MKNPVCRPTRLDHFKDQKNLIQWLEDHRLPVATKDTHGAFAPQANIDTMLIATGATVAGYSASR